MRKTLEEVIMKMDVSASKEMMFPAVIDAQRCVGCTQCKLICPVSAIFQQEVICQVISDKCIRCRRCFGVCPVGSICEDH